MHVEQANPVLTTPESLWGQRLCRAKRWGATLVEFAFIQGLVQVLTAVTGLLIVRTMSKHDYALYAIANSMQTTGNLLADVGISIGVRSIGGRVWNDRERFSALVNTALSLRRRFAVVALAVTLPVSAWMIWRNGASWGLTVGLCFSILAGIIPLLKSSVYNACLQLHAEYRRLQKLDLGNAGMRLGLIGALVLTRMNVAMAVVVNVVANWIQLFYAKRWTRETMGTDAQTNSEDQRELLQISFRSLPNALFFCFQGQVTLLILTLVGNPVGIADMTALGRIAALFTIFSITFANVLAPRFSRCHDRARLRRLYALLVGGTGLVLSLLLFVAVILPRLFLWLLGHQYAGLEKELLWIIGATCLAQIGGTMWSLNSNKAWIHFHCRCFIAVILVVQILAAVFLDLSKFSDLLIFNLATVAAPIPVYLADAWRGLAATCETSQETE